MCNCIERIVDNFDGIFEKETGQRKHGVFLEQAYIVEDGKTKTYSNVEYRYHKNKKDGQPEVRTSKETYLIAHTYCPFCGEKFESSKEN